MQAQPPELREFVEIDGEKVEVIYRTRDLNPQRFKYLVARLMKNLR